MSWIHLLHSFSVFPLINRRKFSQIEVLEGLNVLVCINGRKNKLRVYYLSWLRNKILKGDDVREKLALLYSHTFVCVCNVFGNFRRCWLLCFSTSIMFTSTCTMCVCVLTVLVVYVMQFESGHKVRNGYVSVGDLEHCIHYNVGEWVTYCTKLAVLQILSVYCSLMMPPHTQFNMIEWSSCVLALPREWRFMPGPRSHTQSSWPSRWGSAHTGNVVRRSWLSWRTQLWSHSSWLYMYIPVTEYVNAVPDSIIIHSHCSHSMTSSKSQCW